MIKVGEHITLDIIGTDKEYDPSVYERVIKEIAEAKMKDLNANTVEAAMKIIMGSARSMGIEVKD